jgi:hypothetical protein
LQTFNMLMLPHPIWMWVAAVVELLLAAYVGARLATRNATRPAGEA